MNATEAQRSNPHQRLVPSPWVVRFVPLIKPDGKVLDLACGYGRNARHLAALGNSVLAVDRDEAALATLDGVAGIETRVADLEREPWPFGALRFDAIIVSHYLHRPLFADLLAALRPDGVLIYETFAEGNAVFGEPTRPEFLLLPDELLQWLGATLRVVAFEQGQVTSPFPAVLERICATGRELAWPTQLPLSLMA
jgi:SAM-dependent methyltransferase